MYILALLSNLDHISKLMDVLETDSFEYWGTGSRLHGITVGVF